VPLACRWCDSESWQHTTFWAKVQSGRSSAWENLDRVSVFGDMNQLQDNICDMKEWQDQFFIFEPKQADFNCYFCTAVSMLATNYHFQMFNTWPREILSET
jgi:hypothetical protein